MKVLITLAFRNTPKGDEWELALSQWKELRSDGDAHFEEIIYIDGSALKPQVTWGTSPEMVGQNR